MQGAELEPHDAVTRLCGRYAESVHPRQDMHLACSLLCGFKPERRNILVGSTCEPTNLRVVTGHMISSRLNLMRGTPIPIVRILQDANVKYPVRKMWVNMPIDLDLVQIYSYEPHRYSHNLHVVKRFTRRFHLEKTKSVSKQIPSIGKYFMLLCCYLRQSLC